MIKGNFLNEKSPLVLAINEYENDKSIDFDFGDYAIEIKKSDCGFKIDKCAQKIIISIDKKVDFFRSLLVLSTMNLQEDFSYKEECRFKDFALMLDMSRNSVANLSSIKAMIRKMALMGYNILQLYTEDTFEVENQQYFGYMRGRYTPKEIREIDNYAKNFGIELQPCIQTLAHLNQIRRYANYEKFFDIDDILMVDNDSTYELLENMFSTLSKSFTSRTVNIGMDEAHNLGLGKFLDKFGYQTRYEIMVKHLKRVKEIAEKYGFTLEMWSDMFFRLIFAGEYEGDMSLVPKELIDQIPKDIKLIYWDYYSLNYEKYNRILNNHRQLSANIGFAGGAWKWNGIAPDNQYSIATLNNSIKACVDNGVSKFVLTSWGDNGGEASIFSILPAMFFASEKAYQNVDVEENYNDKDCNYSEIINGIKNVDRFIKLTKVNFEDFLMLDTPNKLARDVQVQRNNSSKFILFDDLLYGTFESIVPEWANETYAQYYKKVAKLARKYAKTEYGYIFATIAKLLDVLAIKSLLSKRIKVAYDAKDNDEIARIAVNDLKKLQNKVKLLYSSLSKQWLFDNKPFGFEVQAVRFGGLIQRIKDVQNLLINYSKGDFEKIYELEENRLKFNYFEVLDINYLIYNLWNVIVSPSLV